jgi:hypothetical protein
MPKLALTTVSADASNPQVGQTLVSSPRLIITYVIPKFHIQSHQPKCIEMYSVNFTKGGGRSDCEKVETGWSGLNQLEYSVREQNAGHRRDTITDNVNDHNRKKEGVIGVWIYLECSSTYTEGMPFVFPKGGNEGAILVVH